MLTKKIVHFFFLFENRQNILHIFTNIVWFCVYVCLFYRVFGSFFLFPEHMSFRFGFTLLVENEYPSLKDFNKDNTFISLSSPLSLFLRIEIDNKKRHIHCYTFQFFSFQNERWW